MSRSSRKLLALTVLLALPAIPAHAQVQTGDLYGIVSDQHGQALPGVTVTIAGVGAPQVQVTDERGQFRFLSLYPGSYDLKAVLDGFSPIDYPDVTVKLGGKADLRVTLSQAVQETITVTTATPLLDERRVTQGTNVATAELNKIPTARDPWSLLSQAPGVVVDRVNVGGNESGQQSIFLGTGSSTRDNVFAVDGVIVTDMNAVGGSATYFDFGAFEEVQLTTSSADVTAATAGVTVNQITKRGTNEWRGTGRFLRTFGSLQAKPAFLNEDTPEGNQIENVDEYGADLGGPLVKDRLWIWGSYGRSDIRNLVPSGGGSVQLDQTKLEDFNSKLNFQLGPGDSGILHYWTNNKLKFGRGAGPNRAPEATHDQTTPATFYKVEDTLIASSNLVFTGLYSHNPGKFTLTPEGGLNAHAFIDANGVHRGTDYDFTQKATIDQYRGDGSYFFNLGPTSNELKFGGSFRDQENHSGTVWPGGTIVVDGALFTPQLDPGIDQVIFPRNRTVAIDARYTSVWLQDTLTYDRWTINAGLRYDDQKLRNLPASDPGNPEAQGLLPPLSFPGNDAGGFDWSTVVPRVGVTYALGQDRKTLLRGSFSRYAEQLGQLPLATNVNPIGYSYAYFYFADANGNHVLDPNEVSSLQFGYTSNIDPNNPGSLAPPSINDKNLKPTLTDEVTLGFEQGFGANFALGVTLTYRHIHDIPELRALILDDATGQVRVATRDDYFIDPLNPTVNGTLPNGQTATVPVYTLRNGLESTGGSLYTNGDREQDYKGITVNLNRRLANRWSGQAHLNYNDWNWKIGPQYRFFHDPTDVVRDGLGFSDRNDPYFEVSGGSGNKGDVVLGSKWSFGLVGLYQVAPDRPWGFNLAGSLNGRQGYISPPYVKDNGGTGSRFVQLAPIEEFRNPDVITLDARIEKELRFDDFNLVLGIDGFNLLNESYVLQRDRNVNDGALANQPEERLSPRVVRLGATLRFR